MKKMITSTAVAILAFTFVGSALAGSLGDEDYLCEGRPEKMVTKQVEAVAAVKADCVDYDTFYTEGANGKCVKGRPTVVQPVLLAGDFNSEGRSEQDMEIVATSDLRSRALESMPAAGRE